MNTEHSAFLPEERKKKLLHKFWSRNIGFGSFRMCKRWIIAPNPYLARIRTSLSQVCLDSSVTFIYSITNNFCYSCCDKYCCDYQHNRTKNVAVDKMKLWMQEDRQRNLLASQSWWIRSMCHFHWLYWLSLLGVPIQLYLEEHIFTFRLIG